MKVRILGAGAGGGFPQWNCNCHNCAGIRAGTLRSLRRTQSSIAISQDGKDWILINASPDIRTQLEQFPESHPRSGVRDSGIKAIILMDSQIDHTTGLLMLREATQALEVYCTEMVKQDLTTGFPLFNMLSHYCGVHHHPIPLDDSPFVIEGFESLRFFPHALKSKAPPYSPHRHDPHDGDNIGLLIEDTHNGKRLYYAPGLGEIEPHVKKALEEADCVLVDGTFWSHDEMEKAGISKKRALEMGHLPQSGPGGMMEELAPLKSNKILIHINNTNPILDETSHERLTLFSQGIDVAHDGLMLEI